MAETDGERDGRGIEGAVAVVEPEGDSVDGQPEVQAVAEAPERHPDAHIWETENIDAVRESVSDLDEDAREDIRSAAENWGFNALEQAEVDGRPIDPEYVRSVREQIKGAGQELHTILEAGGIPMDTDAAQSFVARAREVKQKELLDAALPEVHAEDADDTEQARQAVLRATQRQKMSEMLAWGDKPFDDAMRDWDNHQRIRFVEHYDTMRDEAQSQNAEFDAKVLEEINALNEKYDGLLERIGGGPVSWKQLEAVFKGTGGDGKSLEQWFTDQQAAAETADRVKRLATLLGDESMAESLSGTMLTNQYVNEKIVPLLAQANGRAPEDPTQFRADVTRLVTSEEARADMARREALLKRPEPEVSSPAPAAEQPVRKLGRIAQWRANRAARRASPPNGTGPNQGE